MYLSFLYFSFNSTEKFRNTENLKILCDRIQKYSIYLYQYYIKYYIHYSYFCFMTQLNLYYILFLYTGRNMYLYKTRIYSICIYKKKTASRNLQIFICCCKIHKHVFCAIYTQEKR